MACEASRKDGPGEHGGRARAGSGRHFKQPQRSRGVPVLRDIAAADGTEARPCRGGPAATGRPPRNNVTAGEDGSRSPERPRLFSLTSTVYRPSRDI